MEKPEGKKTSSYLDTLDYDFASSTSCHGLAHVANARGMFSRLFWIIAVLAMCGGLLYQLAKLFETFLKFSAVSEVYVKVSITCYQ